MTENVPQFSTSITTSRLRVSDTLGRFELRKILGQGAQSTVWLAFDPRLEREVALKVLQVGGASDDQSVAQWLQEARSVGRVQHPNIVPVYEADIQDRQPYLVFEYIAGQTLDQLLKKNGPMPAAAAVALMMDVLDAMAVAHAAGVVHRDLKPSNILVDAAGRARVMDFGIAARLHKLQAANGGVVQGGTIGYLSPEAANGAVPMPAMDVFSAALVLVELLAGKPMVDASDPYRAVYRVVQEQLTLPRELDGRIDDRLRAILLHALARDPAQRFADAKAFLAQLQAWAKPADGDSSTDSASSGTLDFLLRRMRHKSDFPALSDSVVRIQALASSDTESVNSVTNEILKDVALTNKLLRVVNSAHYARGGAISTVSRAVTLVGFNGIRNMALSLVLLEHMQDKSHAALLKEEFLRSLMAGTLGAELCGTQRESEEAFIGALFQNLGRLLALYYFPEEALQIRTQVQAPRDAVSEPVAAHRVLGLGYDELGLGVAKAWGLPAAIQRCMRAPGATAPSVAPTDPTERVRWIAAASNAIADTLLRGEAQGQDARVQGLAKQYAPAMGVRMQEVSDATTKARQKLVELAQAMDIRVAPGSAAAKLLTVAPAAGAADSPNGDASLQRTELQATTPLQPPPEGSAQAQRAQVAETLAAGIQDVTNAMVEDFKLSDVLRMILETMYRAMAFDRIIFCMRDARTETLTGRFGLGEGVEAKVRAFKVPLKAATLDLFALVCVKGADTMIQDASDARILQRLPDWYRAQIHAPTFLLLPLQIKGAPLGLIYADKLRPGTLELDEKELAMLRTLRNQAVMAFKQSS